MNPWSDSEPGSNPTPSESKSFEDDFNFPSTESSQQPSSDNKLPDSEEYLNRLENKLQRLKGSASVLKQLKDRREHYIEQLLARDGPVEQRISDLELDQPVTSVSGSGVLRLLNPEQPLTVGEVLHLVRHDELDRTEQEEQPEEDREDDKSESGSKSLGESPPSR